MKRLKMVERFRIPIDGDDSVQFYTRGGLLLARGYSRIVIGGRGPYIEFSDDQIVKGNIYVPKHAEHKLGSSLVYYHEYRSRDDCYVKLYYQCMEVSYADYVVGKWYIDPLVVKTQDIDNLLLPLYVEDGESGGVKGTLFDSF